MTVEMIRIRELSRELDSLLDDGKAERFSLLVDVWFPAVEAVFRAGQDTEDGFLAECVEAGERWMSTLETLREEKRSAIEKVQRQRHAGRAIGNTYGKARSRGQIVYRRG